MTNFITLSDLKTKRVFPRILLFLFLSIVIGYLISPKIIFQPTVYKEGDIILQTININEDLLIPDKVSTRLKQEKLLQEQRRIYDFDPNTYEKSQKKVQSAFQELRDVLTKLEKQTEDIQNRFRNFGLEFFNSVRNLQELEIQEKFYKEYQAVIKARLESLEREGTLSAKGFNEKSKIDADLNIVNQLLSDLQGKRKFYLAENESYAERYSLMSKENENLAQSIEDKKKEAINGFIKALSVEFTDSEQQLLHLPFNTREIERQLLDLLSEVLTRKIVFSREILPEGINDVEFRNLVTGEVSVFNESERFLDLAEARNLAVDIAKESFPEDESGEKKSILILLGQKLISPTVSENKLEFEKRKMELIANTSPVFFSVKKGEIIARTGDRVTQHQVEMINSYYEVMSNKDKLPGMIGIILFVFVALVLVSLTLRLPDRITKIGFKNHLMVMSAVLISLLIVKGGALLGELVETRYLTVQGNIFIYILPITLGAMLIGILLNFEAALMTGLLTALFGSIMMQSNLYYFFYAIIGCLVASLPMTKFDSRYSILLHGLKISAINLPMIIIIFLIESNQVGGISWFSLVAAILAGGLTAILTSILLPFFESLFDVTTNLKLLELANMNHPALKDLILKAPGTYQHSIIVGNLAESAALRVGVNPLLSRVASYYHDVGKVSDPHYFIENQSPNFPNIHDNMDPFESAKIIIQHLSNGTEISEKYRLGKLISDIMQQHHGTNLVGYFYSKAKKMNSVEGEEKPVDESDFRYPGPKPQSIEAALVMLADVSEACVRSLDSPTPELIRKITEKTCWRLLEDGQLDESGLTLKTFHSIVEEYISMLISFYHQRVKYPENDSLVTMAPIPVITTKEN
ncbi:HDIG domain-containing protein [bacterium]|nr:HDIG domain-containing protein [bacterium]